MRPFALPLLLAAPLQADEAALRQIKRIYVDKLTGGQPAAHMRELLIAAIHSTRLFVLTEDPERADVTLRGTADETVYTDTFQYSDGVSARVYGMAPAARLERGAAFSAGVSDREDRRIAERRHEALVSVRLVTKHGEVIWATIQESSGAKLRGSNADVAEKIAKRLAEDVQGARKLP